jgi:hypothetical protein
LTFGDATLHGEGSTGPGLGDFVGIAAHPSGDGYWLVDDGGRVESFGAAEGHGVVDWALSEPIVGITAHPSGEGYWLVARDGGIFAFGEAAYLGGMGGIALNQPIVGIAAAEGHDGYWMLGGDGGVFAFGDATFEGSLHTRDDPRQTDERFIAIEAAGDDGGYFMADQAGNVLDFGATIDP